MSYQSFRHVSVASNAELANEHYYLLLWQVFIRLKLSSRGWLEELSKLQLLDINYIYPTGEKFEFDVDSEFPPNSYRWILFLKEADASGNKPKRTSHLYRRLRLIDLYIKVHHADKARAIFECI